MAQAIIENGYICCPTVGTWFPETTLNIHGGGARRIGRVQQSGRWVDILAPEGVAGLFVLRASEGVWCSRGTPLFEIRENAAEDGFLADEAGKDSQTGDCPSGCVIISSDTDGTVYLRPDPQSKPYVSEGNNCASKETLALVEVMKTFSPVRAPADGLVESVRVREGDSVQAGDALFWFRPA